METEKRKITSVNLRIPDRQAKQEIRTRKLSLMSMARENTDSKKTMWAAIMIDRRDRGTLWEQIDFFRLQISFAFSFLPGYHPNLGLIVTLRVACDGSVKKTLRL